MVGNVTYGKHSVYVRVYIRVVNGEIKINWVNFNIINRFVAFLRNFRVFPLKKIPKLIKYWSKIT